MHSIVIKNKRQIRILLFKNSVKQMLNKEIERIDYFYLSIYMYAYVYI